MAPKFGELGHFFCSLLPQSILGFLVSLVRVLYLIFLIGLLF